MMPDWIIMPVIDCLDFTTQAVADCLAQEHVDPHVLIIDNGSTDETRAGLDDLQLQHEGRVLVWHHNPCLPSLSATWNTALRFVWEQQIGGVSNLGGSVLVVNNDVRLHCRTYQALQIAQKQTQGLFISAVGIRTDHPAWNAAANDWVNPELLDHEDPTDHGGPDFSCFLLTAEGHAKYPFDEAFQPCYCEDLDLHRRYMLGGDTGKIFSINLPFLHYASRTINRSAEALRAWESVSGLSREVYRKKWGGNVNEETLLVPYGEPEYLDGGAILSPPCHLTTPELQEHGCDGRSCH